MFGKFPFSQPFSTKYRLWTRPGNRGLAQVSVRTEHKRKKKPQCRRQRKHLKIISCLFKVIMIGKCVLIMLECNWEWPFGDNKQTNNATLHVYQLQSTDRSFQVVDWKRTAGECTYGIHNEFVC